MKQHVLRVLLVVAFVGLVIGNYRWAESRLHTVPPNLHIAVAAARSLDPGTILKKDDLVVRIRRVHSMDQAFDDPDRLVGRQLRTRARRGAPVEENMLVPLAESRKRSGTFVVVVDADAARCVTPGLDVLLVPTGATKTELVSAPVFCVENVDDAPAGKRRLYLRAFYAEDATRVLAASKDGHFAPVIVSDATVACR